MKWCVNTDTLSGYLWANFGPWQGWRLGQSHPAKAPSRVNLAFILIFSPFLVLNLTSIDLWACMLVRLKVFVIFCLLRMCRADSCFRLFCRIPLYLSIYLFIIIFRVSFSFLFAVLLFLMLRFRSGHTVLLWEYLRGLLYRVCTHSTFLSYLAVEVPMLVWFCSEETWPISSCQEAETPWWHLFQFEYFADMSSKFYVLFHVDNYWNFVCWDIVYVILGSLINIFTIAYPQIQIPKTSNRGK